MTAYSFSISPSFIFHWRTVNLYFFSVLATLMNTFVRTPRNSNPCNQRKPKGFRVSTAHPPWIPSLMGRIPNAGGVKLWTDSFMSTCLALFLHRWNSFGGTFPKTKRKYRGMFHGIFLTAMKNPKQFLIISHMSRPSLPICDSVSHFPLFHPLLRLMERDGEFHIVQLMDAKPVIENRSWELHA